MSLVKDRKLLDSIFPIGPLDFFDRTVLTNSSWTHSAAVPTRTAPHADADPGRDIVHQRSIRPRAKSRESC